jgi:hypothetical protein
LRNGTYNPESKPTWPLVEVEASFRQGAAKLDWVAVWFFWWNSKVIVSPGCAVIFAGWKVKELPPTMILWSWEVEDGEVAVAAGAALDAAGEVDEVPVEVVFPMAAARKAGNLSPGLMAKTMPFWQWPVWRQYAQTGLVSVTVNCACGKGPLVLLSDTNILPRRDQISGETQGRKGNLQVTVEATLSGGTWAIEGGLCDRVILLHEGKVDDIARVCGLVINALVWKFTAGDHESNLPHC